METIGIIGTTLGLYRDNGKENGSYYLGFRVQGNVGPCLILRSPIMCFRAGLFRTQQCLGRSPIMCFDFGALKI